MADLYHVESTRVHDPVPDAGGTEIGLLDLGDRDPLERNLGFQAGYVRWGVKMFHVEHFGYLVPIPQPVEKDDLSDQKERAGAAHDACFFQELSFQGLSRGLAKLDVAAREIEVAVPEVLAQKDPVRSLNQPSGNELDGTRT